MDNVRAALAGLVTAFLVAVTSAFFLGCHLGVARERDAALKAGVARWDVDPKTGVTRFVYGANLPPRTGSQ